MHSYVTSKNVKWCYLIWPTLYTVSMNWCGDHQLTKTDNMDYLKCPSFHFVNKTCLFVDQFCN